MSAFGYRKPADLPQTIPLKKCVEDVGPQDCEGGDVDGDTQCGE